LRILTPLFVFMTKFLDLDAFSTKKHTLLLNGKTYEVTDPLDLPYDQFLGLLSYERKAMKFEATPQKWWQKLLRIKPKQSPVIDSEKQMLAIAEQIRVLAPDIPVKELLCLPMTKLGKLLAFVKGIDGEGADSKND